HARNFVRKASSDPRPYSASSDAAKVRQRSRSLRECTATGNRRSMHGSRLERESVRDHHQTGERAMSVDHCTGKGAHDLADRIRPYWAKRGYLVHVTVQEIAKAGESKDHRPLFAIRSDLVGGLPKDHAPIMFPKLKQAA